MQALVSGSPGIARQLAEFYGVPEICPMPILTRSAPAIAYFSDCIAQGVRPEAYGEEGLADMRVLLAIDQAARSGETEMPEQRDFGLGIAPAMLRSLPTTERRLVL